MTIAHITPRRLFALLTWLSLVVTACHPNDPSRLAADVDRYLRSMQAWASVEVDTDMVIRSILETQFVDEAAVMQAIADSRRTIERHIHDLRATKPETSDVVAIHAEYVAAWVALLHGYRDITIGLDTADGRRLSAGRAALTEWRRALRAVASDLADLARVAGVATRRTNEKGPT